MSSPSPNTVPVAVKTPNNGNVQVSSAATSTAGVGSSLAWSAGAVGSLISKIRIVVPLAAGASSVPDILRIFKFNGTSYFINQEFTVPVQTCSLSAGTGSFIKDYVPPTPWTEIAPTALYAATVAGQVTNVEIEAGDY